VHNPTGLHVLTNEITSKPFRPSISQQQDLHKDLEKAGYDFVIIDMPPGAENLESVKELCGEDSREALIVLTPEMAACASAIRLAQMSERQRIKHNMIANRIRNKGYELRLDEIEEAIGESLIGALPEDENVPASIAQHIPVLLMNGHSEFSRAIKGFSRKISNRVGYEPGEEVGMRGRGLFAWLRRLFAWGR